MNENKELFPEKKTRQNHLMSKLERRNDKDDTFLWVSVRISSGVSGLHILSSDEEEDNNSLSVRGPRASLCDTISNLSFSCSTAGTATPEPCPDITSALFTPQGTESSSESGSLSHTASFKSSHSTSNGGKMYLEIPAHLPSCGRVTCCDVFHYFSEENEFCCWHFKDRIRKLSNPSKSIHLCRTSYEKYK